MLLIIVQMAEFNLSCLFLTQKKTDNPRDCQYHQKTGSKKTKRYDT